MRRMILLFGQWLCATAVFAQLQVVEVRPLDVQGVRPQLSPAGDCVAYQDAQSGLSVLDMQTGKAEQVMKDVELSDDISFAANGEALAYATRVYRDRLPYHAVLAKNLKTKEAYTLEEASRVRYAYRFTGGWLRVARRTTIHRRLVVPDMKQPTHNYVVAVEDDDLVLYDGTKRRVLNPNGQNTYLWARLSPDETRVVYMAINDKCHTYVCDLNGRNVVDLGHYIASPSWLNNDWIIGQQDEDDGHQMTASRLVAIQADGKGFQMLPTPDCKQPINPTAAGEHIVFENEGKLVMMRVK